MINQYKKRKTLADLGINHIILEDKHIYLDRNNPIVGTGGTCIVYNAWRTHKDSMGNDIKSRIILKEFYPTLEEGVDTRKERTNEKVPRLLQSELYRRQKEDEYGEYNAKLERFKSSFDIFSKLYNGSTNGDTVHAYTITEANDTIYIMADYNDAISLSEYMKKDITLYDFVYALMKTAEAVHSLHTFRECTYEGENDNNEGYFHLDITPGNILYHERNRYASIMDADSFVKKNDLKEGRKEICLSASSGYSAPELFINISEELRKSIINERTDVYSVGAIFYEYIMGEKAENNGEGGRYGYEDILEEMLQKRYKDCPRHAVKLVKEFLRKALSKKQSKRYADMQKTAEALGDMLEWLEPKHVYIQDNYNPNNKKVYGRESKIKLIEEKLAMQGGNGRSRVVCISGIGGIGKSTLAKEYARIHESDYEVITEVNADSAKGAVLKIEIINLKESEELKGDPTKDLEYFNTKKRKLIELMSEHRTLLIVHDYNTEEDDFSTWYELGCDIILTSRYEWGEDIVKCTWLKCSDLSEENESVAATKIFESGYISKSIMDEANEEWRDRLLNILKVEETEVREIIKWLNYHPLSIMLMAKQMASESGSEIHPRKMLEEMEQSGIQRHELKIQYEKVGSVGEKEVRNNDVYGHLEWIFINTVKKGRLNDREKEILRYMTLVPSAGGISTSRFKRWTGLEGGGMLSGVAQKGWLEYNSKGVDFLDNEDEGRTIGTYHMPMAISDVLYRQDSMKSTEHNSETFIKKCREFDNNIYKDTSILLKEMEQIKVVCQHFCFKNKYDNAEMLNLYGYLKGEVLSYKIEEILPIFQKALQLADGKIKKNNMLKARIYENIGVAYSYNGDLNKAKEYIELAVSIYFKHPLIMMKRAGDMPRTLTNLGLTYLESGQSDEGLKLLEKTLQLKKKLYKRIGNSYAIELAEGYMNVSCEYKNLGVNSDIAIKYDDEAQQLLSADEAKENKKVKIIFLGNKGIELCKKGNYIEGFQYLQKAINMSDRAYGGVHADTFEYYDGVADVAYKNCLCDNIDYTILDYGIKCAKQLIEFYKKNTNIPTLDMKAAASYCRIAECMIKKGDKNIEEYLQGALNILDEAGRTEDIFIAGIIKDIGALYGEIERYEEMYCYSKRALEIYNNLMNSDYMMIAKSYFNMAYAKYHSRKHGECIKIIENAIKVLKENVEEDTDILAKCYRLKGWAFKEKNNMVQSRKFLQKAEKIDKELEKRI